MNEVYYHGRTGELVGYEGSCAVIHFLDTGEDTAIELQELREQGNEEI